MKNLETCDVKHHNLRPIQNMTYLRNYEATNLWKEKRTLLMAVMRETSEINQLEY
jgi:hypothetical protein